MVWLACFVVKKLVSPCLASGMYKNPGFSMAGMCNGQERCFQYGWHVLWSKCWFQHDWHVSWSKTLVLAGRACIVFKNVAFSMLGMWSKH
jgi:hypothetical protein